MRVQLLVMCASNTSGRAEARLAQLQAALDVFGGGSPWATRGWNLGPWRIGADRWPSRRGFERRWKLGHCQPPRPNWVRLEELTGLLKPPTVHCRLPLLAGDLPTFEHGNPALLLQGIYRAPDGRRRLVATYANEAPTVGHSRTAWPMERLRGDVVRQLPDMPFCQAKLHYFRVTGPVVGHEGAVRTDEVVEHHCLRASDQRGLDRSLLLHCCSMLACP